MKYNNPWFEALPNDYGKGHLPSIKIDLAHAKDILYDNASVIGLTIAILGFVGI